MVFAPLPDPLYVLGTGEIIFIFRFAQPPALTGFFTGFSALRPAAVALMLGITRVRCKKYFTVPAFLFSGSSDHRPLPPGRIMTSWKASGKKKIDGKKSRRKQEEIYLKNDGEENSGRKKHFHIGGFAIIWSRRWQTLRASLYGIDIYTY